MSTEIKSKTKMSNESKGEEKYIILNARGTKIQITVDIGYKISGKLGNFIKQYKGKTPKEEIFIKYSEDTIHQLLDEVNEETFKQFIRLKPNPKARNADIYTVIKQPNKVLLDKAQIKIKIFNNKLTTKQFSSNLGSMYDLLITIGNVSKLWKIHYSEHRSEPKRAISIGIDYPIIKHYNDNQPNSGMYKNTTYYFLDNKQVKFDEDIVKLYVYNMLIACPDLLSQFYDLN